MDNEVKAKFYVNPVFIWRIAGVSTSLLAKMESEILQNHYKKIESIKDSLNQKRHGICEILEVKVSGNDDREAVRNLLNVKRSVFNKKPVKPRELSEIENSVSREEFDEISAYVDLIGLREELIRSSEDIYSQSLMSSGDVLLNAWSETCLKLGISYSNPRIYKDINRLIKGEKLNSKKRRVIEDTLMQYLLRCSTKTSPLSTFTLLAPGKWSYSQDDNYAFDSAIKNVVNVKEALLFEGIDKCLCKGSKRLTTM